MAQEITRIDYKKQLKHLYNPSKKAPSIVDVPPMQFLLADGAGDPNSSVDYQAVVGALYSVAYTIKFTSKKELGQDYGVMPLEGLWWAEDMTAFGTEDKSGWLWTMMIMQPEHITAQMVEDAKAAVIKKKKAEPAMLDRVRLETYHEGLSAHIMYIGPYADEAPTIAALHDFITAEGGQLRGKHHEIYLSDPGRTAPEKLKTIIRQPMERTS